MLEEHNIYSKIILLQSSSGFVNTYGTGDHCPPALVLIAALIPGILRDKRHIILHFCNASRCCVSEILEVVLFCRCSCFL